MRYVLPWLIPYMALGQVTFEMAPKVMGINETFSFIVQIENPESNQEFRFSNGGFDPGDFKLLSQRPTTSFSTTIINGRMSQMNAYTYQLKPSKQGNLEFPSQVVEYMGKTYRSEPLTVEVGPANSQIYQRQRSNDPFEDIFGRRRSTAARPQPELITRAEVPKNEYYVGEAIPFTIKLYQRGVNLDSRGSQMDLPEFDGFWSEEIKRQPKAERGYIGNKIYEVYTLNERRLFANRSGKITIEPTTFTLSVSTGSIFSQPQLVSRSTEPIELEIKPLPQNGRPASFNGSVGQFKLDATLDKTQVAQGDSVSLRIELLGDGNFAAIPKMELEGLDDSIQVFEGGPAQTDTSLGYVTAKSWLYALVPEQEGEFEVPAIEFSYFDPTDQRYHRLVEGPFSLMVTPGDSLPPGVTTTTPSQSIEEAVTALRYIKLSAEGATEHVKLPAPPAILLKALLGFLAIDVLLATGVLIMRRRNQRSAAMRPKYAFKRFKRGVSKLCSQQSKLDQDAYYSELSKTVMGYFGDKWERSGQGITLDEIQVNLDKHGCDPDVHGSVVEIIEGCDLARFTPVSATSRKSLLDKAQETIGKIEEVLR